MKKRALIFLVIIVLILIGILLLVSSSFQITGEVVKNYYTYTKAVCNDANYCEDYKITCEGNEVISFVPTGAIIQFSDGWKDPRSKEIIERTC